MAHSVEDDVHAGDVEESAAGVEREVEEDALGACGAVALPRPLLAAEVKTSWVELWPRNRTLGPQGPRCSWRRCPPESGRSRRSPSGSRRRPAGESTSPSFWRCDKLARLK